MPSKTKMTKCLTLCALLVTMEMCSARRVTAPWHPERSIRRDLPLPPHLHSPDPVNDHLDLIHTRRRTTSLLPSLNRLHNLVIPIRFADHHDRDLPSPSDFEVVFNSIQGDPRRKDLAPTGSVRDVFHVNSYGAFDVSSTVLDWVNISQIEIEAAGHGAYGMSSELLTSLYDAISLANVSGVDLDDFDLDLDGYIDAITFLHSGYQSEWGGTDCFGTDEADRLWSHKWTIPPDLLRPNALSPIKMNSYVIASGLWSNCGSTVARIGLLAHELSHALGVEDLYDTSPERKGRGLGAFDQMSDTWGIDYSQLYPPLMSPWTKTYLGWLEPTVITSSGKYWLNASATSPEAYRIDAGFPDGEYLLIENRQALGFDALIPQGGLAIFHVDEKAPWQTQRGYPQQVGWPENGWHYMISLLQCDGSYDLEQGINSGDAGDLWTSECGRISLGSSSNYPGNKTIQIHPNTDSYQNGNIRQTGLVISEISSSGAEMSFQIDSPHLQEAFVRSEAVGRDPLLVHTRSSSIAVNDLLAKPNVTIGIPLVGRENNPNKSILVGSGAERSGCPLIGAVPNAPFFSIVTAATICLGYIGMHV